MDSINDEEMKTADINKNLVDSYFLLLKDLSPDNKLELIARLSKSMKKEKMAKKRKKILLNHFMVLGFPNNRHRQS